MHTFKTVLSEEVKFNEQTINLSQIKTYQHYIRTPITALASRYNVLITLKYVSIQPMKFQLNLYRLFRRDPGIEFKATFFRKILDMFYTHIKKNWKREHINYYP